jgi:uncharacterized protein YqhQ
MSKKSGKDTGKKTSIGGQALIEGIMMRGVSKAAMAVRQKDGGIDVEEWELPEKKWYQKTPFIRGSFNFVQTLTEGYSCMMKSAEKCGAMEDDSGEEETAFEKWLTEKFGDKLTNIIMAISMVIGVALAVVLFLLVPSFIYTGIEHLVPDKDISGWRTIFEGILKVAMFVGYMAIVAQMKDIKRTYEYHGAEHKTIACYEAGKELTVENIRPMCRFHPRCGTSFIIITLLVSILVYMIVPITPDMFKTWLGFESDALAILLRTLCKLILLPIVVGIAYELIKLAGRYTNIFTRIVSAPGLWMQRITTREPDDSMIEIAIAAITPVLPKEGEDDNW